MFKDDTDLMDHNGNVHKHNIVFPNSILIQIQSCKASHAFNMNLDENIFPLYTTDCILCRG
jgi:hypothetical protein